MGLDKFRLEIRSRTFKNHHRRIRPLVTQIQVAADFHLLKFSLPVQIRFRPFRQIVQTRQKTKEGLFSKNFGGGFLLFHHHIRQSQAIGRKNPGEAVNSNLPDSQRTGESAGMLSPCPAKTGQYMLLDVMTTGNGNFTDRTCHIFIGHGDETMGYFLKRHRRSFYFLQVSVDFIGKIPKCTTAYVQVQRLIFFGPKNSGEKFREQSTQHKICVGERQWAAVAVTHGTGIGPRRFRSH